jgi:centriolar protein POC1
MKSTKKTINPFLLEFGFKEIVGHNGPIYSIDADDSFLYSASSDKFVTRWLKENGEQDAFAVRCEDTPFAIKVFSNQSKLAVGLSTGQLHIIDLLSKRETHHFIQHKTGIFAMHESVENGLLIVGDADGMLSIWETDSMKLVIVLPLSCGKIRSIKKMNAQTIVIAGGNGDVIHMELEFMNELERFYAHEGGTTALCVDEKRQQLISGGKDGYLRWWDATSFRLLKALPAHKGNIYELAFFSDDQFISVSRDKTVKFWDAAQHKVLHKMEGEFLSKRQSINSLWCNQNGQFAFAGDDKKIHFYANHEQL